MSSEDNIDEPEQDQSGIDGGEPGDGAEHSTDSGNEGEAASNDPTQSSFGLPHKKGRPQVGGDPDDMLFENPEAGDSSEQFAGREQFKEGSPAQWAGHQLAADEIGIPVEKEPGYLSGDDDFGVDTEQELQLIDDETQLGSAQKGAPSGAGDDDELALDEGAPATEAAAEAEQPPLGDGDFFVLDEAEAGEGTLLAEEPLPVDNYPVEEGWEPVGERGIEEPTLEPAAEVAAEQEDYGQPDGEALEEQYYEEPATAVVAAAPRAPGRLLRLMASAAAAVIVVGAGAVVVLRPEWLGLHFEPQLVERVQVARPEIASRVPTPPKPVVQVATRPDPRPTPRDPVATGPEPRPVVPGPVEGPTGTDPTPTDPVVPTDPVGTGPATDAGKLPDYMPVGENLWIGTPDAAQREVADWAPVRLGAKAFAQLHNGNFFIGSVKTVARDAIVLTVPTGEITLPKDDVQRVTTLDSSEYAELQQATTGFLKLSNNNRLIGAILKSVVDDNYVLQMRSDRIVVPRSAVERVVEQPGVDGLRFGTARDEEEWLRQIAARELRSMSTGAPAPGPEVRQRAPSGRPLPIKQVGKQLPGATRVEPKSKTPPQPKKNPPKK